MNKHDVLQLINELSTAAQEYYQGSGESLLTDAQFDYKQELLRENAQKFPELFEKGSKGHELLEGKVALGSTPGRLSVTHSTPMLSLAKAKTEAELDKFLEKAVQAGAKEFKIEAKLDGIALSAVFNNDLERLATRGDGDKGDDVTFLLKDPLVTIVGLPETLDGQVELRGELFFTEEQYKKVNEARYALSGDYFKNSRNAAAGLLKKAELGVDYPVEFTFATYSTLKDGVLSEIDETGIKTAESLTKTPGIETTHLKSNEVLGAITAFGKIRETLPIPTDGVVVKPQETAAIHKVMGSGNHHPHSQIAWKYPSDQAVSTILEIAVTVGKSGRLTPTAQISPVELDGSTVSYASLHNFSILNNLDARIGSKVLVEKANEIIPQIVEVLENSSTTKKFPIPTECHYCETTLISDGEEWPPKTLECPNLNCPSRELFALKTAVGRGYLDIDRLGAVTIEELFTKGVISDIGDLYSLTIEDLKDSTYGYSPQGNPRRLGESISQHVLERIEASKTKTIDLVLGSLAINGLGRRTARSVLKKFPTLSDILDATVEELVEIDGIGEKTANSIVEGLKEKQHIIDKLLKAGVEFTPLESESSLLEGKSYTISGKVPAKFANRKEMVEFIESNGGEFHSSPRSTTMFMIGDSNSSSSKIKKAKALGLTIVSPEEVDF